MSRNDDLPESLREFVSIKEHKARDAQARRKKAAPMPGSDDPRPVVQVEAGKIGSIVDAVEAALIAKGGLYQHSSRIVAIGRVPLRSHDNLVVTASRIMEVGDEGLAEAIAAAAVMTRFDVRANALVAIDVPTRVVRTLRDRKGRYRFPVLAGIVNAPTLRADGTILDQEGFDEATGLYVDFAGETFPKIRPKPDRKHAEAALTKLSGLIRHFPFENEESRSVALSAILTATVRRGLDAAPLHGFSARAAGSGKSMLGDIVSVISSGQQAAVTSQTTNPEEFEKQVNSLLLEGAPLISIDNCSIPLEGNTICSALTQPIVSIRPFGKLERVQVQSGAFWTANGNNLVIAGDMTRRAIVAALDAGMERPELRRFDFDPVARAKAERGTYLAAALTILLAYRNSGISGLSTPLGSFEEWSQLVRDALLWLGCADPVVTMERGRQQDPKRSELFDVLVHWKKVIGTKRTTVRQIVEMATKQSGFLPGRTDFDHPDFREALLAVAGRGGAINGKLLGMWLSTNEKVIAEPYWVVKDGTSDGSNAYRLVERESSKTVNQEVHNDVYDIASTLTF